MIHLQSFKNVIDVCITSLGVLTVFILNNENMPTFYRNNQILFLEKEQITQELLLLQSLDIVKNSSILVVWKNGEQHLFDLKKDHFLPHILCVCSIDNSFVSRNQEVLFIGYSFQKKDSDSIQWTHSLPLLYDHFLYRFVKGTGSNYCIIINKGEQVKHWSELVNQLRFSIKPFQQYKEETFYKASHLKSLAEKTTLSKQSITKEYFQTIPPRQYTIVQKAHYMIFFVWGLVIFLLTCLVILCFVK